MMKWSRLGHGAALLLLLTIVIARACTLEVLRDAFPAAPGTEAVPRGTGPATSVLLDWICCATVLLMLFSGKVRWTWSHLFFLALACLAMVSAIWADDKFATLVQSFHLMAAAALFFAAAQLIQSWPKLRLIGAICFGLLLIYAANGVYYRLVELPELREHWNKEKHQILADRGWDENSFQARQFGQRIENGAMMGFNSSPNSFAAVIVLLSIVSLGLAIQRYLNRDSAALTAPIAIVLAVAWTILYFTQSKAAFVTLVLGILMLTAVALLRRRLATHPARFFWIGTAIVCLVIAAVVGHGVYHHRLPGSSLDFRWKYWVASMHLFLARPWLGVGWDNFGLHYLAFRLPEAPEEIKDPHDFLVRFFVELGIAGGLLAIGWLVSFWWKATQATLPQPTEEKERSSPILGYLVAIGAIALLINILISIDLAQNGAFVFIEVVKRFLFFCLFLLGSVIAAIGSTDRAEIDQRPAPWILYGLLIALGLFLIHNLIEFSLFEPGPMMLFAVLSGAALGVRMAKEPVDASHTVNVAWRLLGSLASLAWLAALVLLVIPVMRAEAAAQQGDEELRTRHFSAAIADLSDAFAIVPWNADYAQRAAMAMIYAHDSNSSAVLELLKKALAANPSNITTSLTIARYDLDQPDVIKYGDDIRRSYADALRLNPNDVEAHLEYAAALERLQLSKEALKQYELALAYNDKLNRDEPKRLPADRLQRIRRKIEVLSHAH